MDEERIEMVEVDQEDDTNVAEESESSMSTGVAMLIGGLLTAAAFIIGTKVKDAIMKAATKVKEEKEEEPYDDHTDDDDEESDEDDEES